MKVHTGIVFIQKNWSAANKRENWLVKVIALWAPPLTKLLRQHKTKYVYHKGVWIEYSSWKTIVKN